MILVDNASTDDSLSLAKELCPAIKEILLSENYGFCRAVNEGIKASRAPFVLLLNNDTVVDPDFVGTLYEAIKGKEKVFSCASQMRKMTDPSRMDDGGDFYCALGWAFARGKDKPYEKYTKPGAIFFSWRRSRRSTEEKSLKRSDILMRSILPIWRIWMLATGQGSSAMRTVMSRRPLYIIWEAERPVPATMSSRYVILPGIIFMWSIKICLFFSCC